MKKLHCVKCGQVYWTDLKEIDESLVGSAEWVKNPCPKCGGEWAEVQPPRAGKVKRAVKRGKGTAKRRKSRSDSKKKIPGFAPRQMRSLRKKIGISQKELAALVGVNRATVNLWEGGKFKPKEEKVGQLAALAGVNKEEVRKMLAEKMSKHPQWKKPEEVQAQKPNSKKGGGQRATNRSKK
jgi:DNA-binding XRE family transcriptional regulator